MEKEKKQMAKAITRTRVVFQEAIVNVHLLNPLSRKFSIYIVASRDVALSR